LTLNVSSFVGVVISLVTLATSVAFIYWRKEVSVVVEKMLTSIGEPTSISNAFGIALTIIGTIVALGSFFILLISLNSLFT
jgi:hypothetical protein